MRIAPLAHRQLVFWRRPYVPNVSWRMFAGGMKNGIPKFGCPSKHAKVFVSPVVTRTTHRVAFIPSQVLVYRVHWIAGVLHAHFPKFIKDPNVKRRQRGIGTSA